MNWVLVDRWTTCARSDVGYTRSCATTGHKGRWQIAAVYESIPASVRSETVIFTSSYGEAGAIDVLRPARSLPRAYSGHNHHGLWGPPDSQGPIAVGYVDDVVQLFCSNAEQVGTVTNPYGVENEEAGLPIYLCLDPDRGLAEVWDSVRHLS